MEILHWFNNIQAKESPFSNCVHVFAVFAAHDDVEALQPFRMNGVNVDVDVLVHACILAECLWAFYDFDVV